MAHGHEYRFNAGARPQDSAELGRYFSERFSEDPISTIKALKMLGLKPELKHGVERLRVLLDCVRTSDIPTEISILAQTFEALVAMGADYAEVEYFRELIGRLQNPDGGVRKPDSAQSNIYDTIAALRMAELLPALQAQ